MATVENPVEQTVILRNASWQTYERLLDERQGRAPRLTYDRGALEIVSPISLEHEEPSGSICFVVRILLEELNIDFAAVGSMTLKREDIEGGIEPDASFYIQNEPRIRGKRELDLLVDPPPDLAIEVDITNPSLQKLPIYGRFGVPEVWRYDGATLDIHVLQGDRYVMSARSVVVRGVTADALSAILGRSKESGAAAWQRRVRG